MINQKASHFKTNKQFILCGIDGACRRLQVHGLRGFDVSLAIYATHRGDFHIVTQGRQPERIRSLIDQPAPQNTV